MKALSTVLGLLIATSMALPLSAQKEITPVTRNAPYSKMIHFNPLPLFVGGFEMGFEHATTHKESFYTQLGYYTSEPAGSLVFANGGSGDYEKMNGLRLELQYRFYRKTNNYIKNVFIGPYFNFKTLSANYVETKSIYNGPPTYTYTTTTTTEKRAATTVSVGYMMGIRKSVFENIYMDFSFGGGIYIPVAGDYHKELNIPFVNPYQRGVQFRANLGFCIAL